MQQLLVICTGLDFHVYICYRFVLGLWMFVFVQIQTYTSYKYFLFQINDKEHSSWSVKWAADGFLDVCLRTDPNLLSYQYPYQDWYKLDQYPFGVVMTSTCKPVSVHNDLPSWHYVDWSTSNCAILLCLWPYDSSQWAMRWSYFWRSNNYCFIGYKERCGGYRTRSCVSVAAFAFFKPTSVFCSFCSLILMHL